VSDELGLTRIVSFRSLQQSEIGFRKNLTELDVVVTGMSKIDPRQLVSKIVVLLNQFIDAFDVTHNPPHRKISSSSQVNPPMPEDMFNHTSPTVVAGLMG
jgi:hypothetical protein